MKTLPTRSLGFGLLIGVLLGAGGLYLAQWRGWLPDWFSRSGERRERAENETAGEHGHGADEQEEHDDRAISLSPEVMQELDMELSEAAGGELVVSLSLPGEVVLNADRLAHIVPRVSGIVREVRKSLGETVSAGEVMAVLESRELAEAKGEYLAAGQRLALARANIQTNEELKAKGIVSDLDYLSARKDLEDAEINLRAADVKLHTLGLSHEELGEITDQDEEALLVYELRAPCAGVVVEKHITLGELVTTESDVFVLADLSDVWVDLTVYQKDLAKIRSGQQVTIRAAQQVGEDIGPIMYVSPVVVESTRTAIARVTLPNTAGRWRPGLFVTGNAQIDRIEAAVLVPIAAVQTIDDKPVVFVQTTHGFEPREVTLGRADGAHVEIESGLAPGERFVSRGAFALKAELAKERFGEGHAH